MRTSRRPHRVAYVSMGGPFELVRLRPPRHCENPRCGNRLRKRTAQLVDFGQMWVCPRCHGEHNGARRRRIREMRRLGIEGLIEVRR